MHVIDEFADLVAVSIPVVTNVMPAVSSSVVFDEPANDQDFVQLA